MQFSEFALYLQQLETTSARLELSHLLAEVFSKLQPSEIKPASYLLQGRLVPPYDSTEFNLSIKMVLRVLARFEKKAQDGPDLFDEFTGEEVLSSVTKKYKKIGDVGTLAAEIFQANQPTTHLDIKTVYDALWTIAQTNGVGSQARKLELLSELFRSTDALSAKFIARIVVGKLRLGFSTMTLLDALSWAMTKSKDESKLLELAYQKKADVGRLAEVYLAQPDPQERQGALENMPLEIGVPVVPALCQRLNSAQEIIEKMHEVVAEPKYDGLRVQLHVHKATTEQESQLKIFTRNLEDVSEMFPEAAEVFKVLQCESCILDAEVIAYDKTTGQLVSFQQTSTRRRKHGVTQKAADLPVRFYVFDVLSLNGNSLLDKKLRERKELLSKLFLKNEVFLLTEYIITKDANELRTFHEHQLQLGLEGAVIKQLDSHYQSGRKGWSWVKIKEEEGTRGKLNDTLDCVIMGYYKGTGKRAEFEIGALLVGVLDEANGQVLSISKVGSGLSEETSLSLFKRLQSISLPEMPAHYQVHKNLIPDVWVSPQLVIEVAADEISTSPIHTAGVALRFPRFLQLRHDKTLEQATTTHELLSIQ